MTEQLQTTVANAGCCAQDRDAYRRAVIDATHPRASPTQMMMSYFSTIFYQPKVATGLILKGELGILKMFVRN